jgi:hypothetical protein
LKAVFRDRRYRVFARDKWQQLTHEGSETTDTTSMQMRSKVAGRLYFSFAATARITGKLCFKQDETDELFATLTGDNRVEHLSIGTSTALPACLGEGRFDARQPHVHSRARDALIGALNSNLRFPSFPHWSCRANDLASKLQT